MNKFHFFRVLVCALSLASVTLFVAPPAAQATQAVSDRAKIHADFKQCIDVAQTPLDSIKSHQQKNKALKALGGN